MMIAENAIVLGLGVSGEAAARLLVRQGATVTVVDRAAAGSLIAGEIESLLALGVRVLMGVTSLPVDAFDLCVVSPGIDQASAWVREMERRDVEVISELELGFRYCVCPIIAVTGTNGKSTLVKLLSDVLRLGGIRTEIAGNYGTPLSSVVEQGAAWDWIVVEVSSFQLERVSMFHPRVGVLLNIQPDHLNRHGDMQTYRTLKSRLFNCMGEHDVAVVHDIELSGVKSLVTGAPQWVSFGLSAEANVTYDATEGVVCRDDTGKRVAIRVAGTAFDNPVLGLAVAAAVATVRSCGINPDLISEYLQKFTPLSHRIEAVRIVDDISFVDDSKATNLAALRAGIEIIKGPVRLIAGGQLKEKDLEFVKEVLARNVACVYVIGEASELLIRAWQDTVPCLACGELAVAVRLAFKNAVPGDTVLLSPGCASFDQFRSYRDRGEQFKRIVEEIKEERKHENIVDG